MGKKNFTLDKTWRLCLSMWRWIAKQKREGRDMEINGLKAEWLRKKGITEDIQGNCFFCHYCPGHCGACPGKKVDPSFECTNDAYQYYDKPIAFYNKLVSLNRKRKQKSIRKRGR